MKSISILLIEDNPADERLIKEMLKEIKSFDYTISSADTLKEGIEQIQTGSFEIILLDLNLPDSTGQQTFQKVLDCCKQIPIVLISEIDDEKLALKLINEGAQDYITKHSLTPALGKSIQYAIERKRTQEAMKIKINELENWNKRMSGRELRMVDLKKEVNELLVRLGEKEKYRKNEE